MNILIRETTIADRVWIRCLLEQEWGSVVLVTKGRIYEGTSLSGFCAISNKKRIGLLLYRVENEECEIVSLNSLEKNKGIGSALLSAIIDQAKKHACRRIWLITTNDNTDALRFYQTRGFTLSHVYPNAIESSRKLKPEIPFKGINGIPIRDEIELEILF